METSFLTYSSKQTQKLGKLLAEEIAKTEKKTGAFVLGLKGDLGGGKTTFLQGFAKGLGIKEKITSPTFVLMKKFRIPNTKFQNFYHFDCYRIGKPKEILEMGFREIISNPQNIVALEWADKIKSILPKNVIRISFDFINQSVRKIKINYGSR